MLDRVFGECALQAVRGLEGPSAAGEVVDMEAVFSQLTLDVIGKVGRGGGWRGGWQREWGIIGKAVRGGGWWAGGGIIGKVGRGGMVN